MHFLNKVLVAPTLHSAVASRMLHSSHTWAARSGLEPLLVRRAQEPPTASGFLGGSGVGAAPSEAGHMPADPGVMPCATSGGIAETLLATGVTSACRSSEAQDVGEPLPLTCRMHPGEIRSC